MLLLCCCTGAYLLILITFVVVVWSAKEKSKDKKLATYFYERAQKAPADPYVFDFVEIALICAVKYFYIFVISIIVINIPANSNLLSNFISQVDWDQWFNTLFVGISIPVLIATTASISIFFSHEKSQFIFYDVKDLLISWKIPLRMSKGAIWLLMCIATLLVYYIIDSADVYVYAVVLLPICAITITVGCIFSIYHYLYVLAKTVEFLFRGASYYRMLDRLYMKVYHQLRVNNENITETSTNRVLFYLQYILDSIPNYKLQNEKIKFICFLENSAYISKKIVCIIVLKFSLYIGLLVVVLGLSLSSIYVALSSSAVAGSRQWLDMLWTGILCYGGAAVLTILICNFKEIRNVAIQCVIGAWGFVSDSSKSVVFTIHYSPVWSTGAMSKKMSLQLRGYYNVISAFRDTLCTNQELADQFIRALYDTIEKNSHNALLYPICLCLYKEKYSTIRIHIKDFCTLLCLPYIDEEKMKVNTIAILNDVLRRDPDKLVSGVFEEAIISRATNILKTESTDRTNQKMRRAKNYKYLKTICESIHRVFNRLARNLFAG